MPRSPKPPRHQDRIHAFQASGAAQLDVGGFDEVHIDAPVRDLMPPCVSASLSEM